MSNRTSPVTAAPSIIGVMPQAVTRTVLGPQGMLSIGAAALGCPHVLGVDVDPDALDLAASNLAEAGDDLPVRCSIHEH